MAYTPGNFNHEHVLMQWGGKLPGGEQWSCSLRLAEQSTVGAIGTQVPPQAEIASWLSGSMKDAVAAYHGRATTHINSVAKLSFVKANRINVDGTYMDAATNEYVFADLAGGGGDTPQHPNQATVCVSLTTGYTRGPAHRGRFYLPTPAVNLQAADGRMDAATTAQIKESTKTFLEAIADIPGIDSPVSLTPVVMSRKAGAAAYRVITGVEVGQVVDTQRRRRKNQPETYSSIALELGAY